MIEILVFFFHYWMCGAPISASIILYWFLAVNCMYWEKRFPRLVSTQQLKELKEKGSPLVGISDITCDVGGSLEFVNQTTSFAKPFFRYFFMFLLQTILKAIMCIMEFFWIVDMFFILFFHFWHFCLLTSLCLGLKDIQLEKIACNQKGMSMDLILPSDLNILVQTLFLDLIDICVQVKVQSSPFLNMCVPKKQV